MTRIYPTQREERLNANLGEHSERHVRWGGHGIECIEEYQLDGVHGGIASTQLTTNPALKHPESIIKQQNVTHNVRPSRYTQLAKQRSLDVLVSQRCASECSNNKQGTIVTLWSGSWTVRRAVIKIARLLLPDAGGAVMRTTVFACTSRQILCTSACRGSTKGSSLAAAGMPTSYLVQGSKTATQAEEMRMSAHWYPIQWAHQAGWQGTPHCTTRTWRAARPSRSGDHNHRV